MYKHDKILVIVVYRWSDIFESNIFRKERWIYVI